MVSKVQIKVDNFMFVQMFQNQLNVNISFGKMNKMVIVGVIVMLTLVVEVVVEVVVEAQENASFVMKVSLISFLVLIFFSLLTRFLRGTLVK